ncbi:glycosyltransferase family 4 protein [Paenibacillus qinlingensis]|uniref:Phosphatidylinositol alpha-1,6-mannosyltransferase n=1 Tax=Paenibacillus qinlingensis TaxID=1837343 RepID=A0ABU1P3V5_9BACL|nr:glycosyltransferase family 4 protein [Paenibacillus qinlingensis]MDR6554428.1 phosphatidylinositol alpha-1,6-mannosyltransferase [Paenibacillus qinlingensis]
MNRKKVVLVAGVFPPGIGGMQSYYYNLSKHTKHEITVLAPAYPGSEAFDGQQSFRTVRGAFMRNERAHILSWGRLFRHVRKMMVEEPDVTVYGYVLIGIIGLLFRVFGKRRYVISTHGMDMLMFRRFIGLNQIVKLILVHADGVLTNSIFTRKLVEDYGVDPSRIRLVHPGVEAVFDQRSANVELIRRHGLEDKYVILSVGRLVTRKGQDRVIEAMPEILKHIPNAVYVIVGDGPDRARLEHIVQVNGVSDAVIFIGSISGSESLNDYYNMADQFIMVCRELEKGDAEGFGIVYLEAASAGVPVIAGRSGGALEAVLDGVTGLLVNPDSHTEIIESVLQLAQDHALRDRLITAGYKRAKTGFQYEVLAEIFDQYVEELCASPRANNSKLVRKRPRMKQDIR